MKTFTGLYISLMIVLLIYWIVVAIKTYREYGTLNHTIADLVFGNRINSNGGFNQPTYAIIMVTGIYAFCWLVYLVLHLI